MAHAGGRPLKFQSVEDLQKQIDAYFAECDPHVIFEDVLVYPTKKDAKGRVVKEYDKEPQLGKKKVLSDQIPYTITGLALALDTSRETLLDYENENNNADEGSEDIDPDVAKFSDTIKKAKLKIHNFAELRLFENNPTGTIFNLKNNYGWKDKTEQDITTGGDKINIALVEFKKPDGNNKDSSRNS